MFGQSLKERKPLPVDAKIQSSKKPRKKTKIEKSLEKTSASLQLKKISFYFKTASHRESKDDISNSNTTDQRQPFSLGRDIHLEAVQQVGIV